MSGVIAGIKRGLYETALILLRRRFWLKVKGSQASNDAKEKKSTPREKKKKKPSAKRKKHSFTPGINKVAGRPEGMG